VTQSVAPCNFLLFESHENNQYELTPKREGRSAAQPQPKFGLSRAKHVLSDVEGTPRPQRSDKKGVNLLARLSIFSSELGVLCPFDVAQGGESIEPRLGARQSPCSSIPDYRKLCASRENFQP
jgi:hypothetical protein